MRRLALAALILLPPAGVAQHTPEAPMPEGPMPGMDMGQHAAHPATPMPSRQKPASHAEQRPSASDDLPSVTRPAGKLQEAENQSLHTGEELPAPDLLAEVRTRTPMRADDFVMMAERRNPTLGQTRADVARAEQQARQAAMWPNPMIGYSGDHIRGGSYGGGEQGAYVQQEIVLGGKLGLRRDVYRQESKAAQIAVDVQRYRVRGSVEQAFYHALAAQSLVTVRQQLLHIASDTVETARRLANVGQADAPDVLQAEVEREQAKVELVRAQRDYLQSFHVLAAAAGAQTLEVTPLQGELEQPPAIDAAQQVATILAGSPEVKQAQQEAAAAEAQWKAAKREPVPNLTVKAGEWWSGELTEGAGRAAGPESFVNAGLVVPLWNRNQGNVDAAKAAMERAQLEVSRIRLEVEQQAAPLAQAYGSAQFEAERYRTQILPRARRAYELYRMKYQQMAAAYPQVLMSQQTLVQLQVDYLHVLEAEWTSAVALETYAVSAGAGDSLSLKKPVDTLSAGGNLPNGGSQ